MYYLSDIKYNVVNQMFCFNNEDDLLSLGWDKSEKEQTGIFIDELPQKIVSVSTLCCDLETKEVWYSFTLEQAKEQKLSEISATCGQLIDKGIEYNGKLYSFTIEDQADLKDLEDEIKNGKQTLSYHANGCMCELYSANDIIEIITLAKTNKFIQITYSNHLKEVVRRAEKAKEVLSVKYGDELPSDLQEHFNEIVGAMTNETT